MNIDFCTMTILCYDVSHRPTPIQGKAKKISNIQYAVYLCENLSGKLSFARMPWVCAAHNVHVFMLFKYVSAVSCK